MLNNTHGKHGVDSCGSPLQRSTTEETEHIREAFGAQDVTAHLQRERCRYSTTLPFAAGAATIKLPESTANHHTDPWHAPLVSGGRQHLGTTATVRACRNLGLNSSQAGMYSRRQPCQDRG
jgi:hypothetical protein